MNFYTMQLGQFMSKLKGLIKKIAKSSVKQIESHTQTCHDIIVELIKDEDILNGLNSQKLRLLSYEAILFLVEMMNSRDQEAKSRALGKNKIEGFLCEIYQTLTAIKQLLSNLDIDRSDGLAKRTKNLSSQSNGFDRLDRNLNQYQQRLGNILTEFQQTNNSKNQQKQPSQSQKILEQDNDFLIDQMHRIIEKKEKRISQLTRLLQSAEHQKIDMEILFKKIQNQMEQKNSSLLRRIEQINLEQTKMIETHEQQKLSLLQDQKQSRQTRMKIEQIINQKIIGRFSQCNNMDFNNKIQALTQQTICSAKTVKQNDRSSRKMSLEKVGSTRSFRRITFGEDKDSVMNQKKYKELIDKNEQLYRFIYCQAATIEELL